MNHRIGITPLAKIRRKAETAKKKTENLKKSGEMFGTYKERRSFSPQLLRQHYDSLW